MWKWILVLILCVLGASLLISGGFNWAFLKILGVLVLGFVVLIAGKKLYDIWKK